MKIKEDQYLNKWEHIFKIWPVKTEDGFTVFLDSVWRMKTDDIRNPVRYHTNPLSELVDRLDEFLEKRLTSEAETITGEINAMRDQVVKKRPLTEGKMRHGNGPPPFQSKRPTPPPAPPRPRRIGGEDITMEKILDAWDLKKDKTCPKCGTTDCITDRKLKVSSAGAISIKPSDLLKSCKVRQQLKAMDKIKFEGKNKTGSMGPR